MARREQFTVNELTITGSCNLRGGNAPGNNPYGGQDYIVDGNKVTNGPDGKTFKTAYNTLSTAITASNLSIASSVNRWWARRNRIFVCGDQEITENLTIFPEKCDVIGFGHDLVSKPRITGTHVIAALATGKAYGTRFFNCGFMNNAAGPTIHLVADEMGVQLHGCDFWPVVTGSTHCVYLQISNAHFQMTGCRIMGHPADYATGIFAEGIKIDGTAQHDMVIRDNYIRATEGIHIVAGTGGYNTVIRDNVIHAVALCVNDLAGLSYGINNRMITDANTGADALLGVVATKSLWSGNKLTGVAGTQENADYPFPVQFTS